MRPEKVEVQTLFGPVLPYGAFPLIGHQLVAGIGGMNAVPDPVIGGSALDGVVENSLEMDHGRMILGGEAGDGFLTLPDSGKPGVEVILVLSYRQRKRFAEHNSEARVAGHGIGEQLIVGLLEILERQLSAGIVDANENAQDVWVELQRVFAPAAGEIGDGVAADAAIEKGQIAFRQQGAEPGGDQEGIAVAQNVIGVGGASAVAVRNGIALEEDAGSLTKRGHDVGGAQQP